MTELRDAQIAGKTSLLDVSVGMFPEKISTESGHWATFPSPIWMASVNPPRARENKKTEEGGIHFLCLSWGVCLPLSSNMSAPKADCRTFCLGLSQHATHFLEWMVSHRTIPRDQFMSTACILVSTSFFCTNSGQSQGGHHFPEQAMGFSCDIEGCLSSPAPCQVWETQLGHGAMLWGGQAWRHLEKLARNHRWNTSIPCCSLLHQEGLRVLLFWDLVHLCWIWDPRDLFPSLWTTHVLDSPWPTNRNWGFWNIFYARVQGDTSYMATLDTWPPCHPVVSVVGTYGKEAKVPADPSFRWSLPPTLHTLFFLPLLSQKHKGLDSHLTADAHLTKAHCKISVFSIGTSMTWLQFQKL